MRFLESPRVLGLTLLFASLACSGSEAAGPRNPLAGTWDVTVAGDNAYGKVWWARTIARQPPGYEGTFVAHRR